MRRGIGLRGYAQQDPLNEFRREAFRLYEELRGLIRHGVASTIFRVTVTREPTARRRAAIRPSAPSLGPRRSRARAAARTAGGPATAVRAAASAGRGGRRAPAAGPPSSRGGSAAGPVARADPRIARRRRPVSAPARRRRQPAGGARPGLHAERRPDRAQRPVLVRLGRQVQEVPRPLIRGRVAAIVRRDLIRLAGAACLGAASWLGGYATYRIWAQGQTSTTQRPADAIVVMGAAQYDGRPSPVFAARLDHAVDLYLAGVAPHLVVTGGKAEGDRTTEAAAARAFAIGRGVPADAILIEDQSRTTLESVRVGRRDPARRNDLHSAVFVSDRPHMLRVLRMAARRGHRRRGDRRPRPARSSATPAGQVDATVHELGALGLSTS